MTNKSISEETRELVEHYLHSQHAQVMTRNDLRLIVNRQVARVLAALREKREESAELYGPADIDEALGALDDIDEALGEALELMAEGELSCESHAELLQNLSKAWAAARRARRDLKPHDSTFVPGLSDDSEELTAGDIDTSDNDGAEAEDAVAS